MTGFDEAAVREYVARHMRLLGPPSDGWWARFVWQRQHAIVTAGYERMKRDEAAAL